MSLISSLPTVPDADEPPPLGDAPAVVVATKDAQAEACDVKRTAASSSAATAEPADDSACSVASLRKYYDECAFFYDEAPEGEENTYICVDRVTNSLLAAQHRLAHTEFESESSGAEAASSSSIQTTPVRGGAIEKLFVTPAPLAPVSALSMLDRNEVESPLSAAGASASASPSHTPSPCASPDPLSRPAMIAVDPSTSPSAVDSPRSSTASLLSSSPVSSLEPSSPRSINDSLAAAAVPLKILDLGVGTGLASRPLFSALSTPRLRVARSSTEGESRVVVPEGTVIPEIWGVDLSPNMLKVSSVLPFAHLIAADLNTALADPLENPGSPLACPASNGYFDCALSVGTLEFVRDHAYFLSQVRSFLRIGGLFCGTFPSNKSQTVCRHTAHSAHTAAMTSSGDQLAAAKTRCDAIANATKSLRSLVALPRSLRFLCSPSSFGLSFLCCCSLSLGSAQYPDMSFTTVSDLVDNARISGGMEVLEVQQYRGWSVSSSEHVEYIQILAQKRR